MKKILVVLFIPMASFAQNKIDGLGPFKIGKTLCSKIPSFADTSQGRLFYAKSEYPKTETWYAGYYQIAGMWIEDLTLVFYHDTLYSITCRGSDSLDLALSAKYGQGKITTPPDKIVKCRTGLKIEYTEEEKHMYVNYPTTNKNITAIRMFGDFFDDECKKVYFNTYTILNNKTEVKVIAQNYWDEANKKKKEEQDMNKKLKDF
jgi:hypothetical protein